MFHQPHQCPETDFKRKVQSDEGEDVENNETVVID